MGKRRAQPGRLKLHHSYTTAELTNCLGVCRATLHNWIKRGLRVSDAGPPMLIRGQDAHQFLTLARAANKRPCAPDEIYCVRCRRACRPLAQATQYVPKNATHGALVSECPTCGTRLTRLTTEPKAVTFLAALDSKVVQNNEDIVGSRDNTSNYTPAEPSPEFLPNPRNERMKREYFSYLRLARGRDLSTIDKVEKAVSRFERYIDFKDFRTFSRQQATGFKTSLLTVPSSRTGKVIGLATAYAVLGHVERFFDWLSTQKGYRSRVRAEDVDYLTLSKKDSRVATARRERDPPTSDQILAALEKAPRNSSLDQRDRALMAFIFLTGVRDGAVVSLKIKHLDLARKCVFQDAREVKTKNRKTINTWFFPVDEVVRAIVEEWVRVLERDLDRGPDDYLFPAVHVAFNSQAAKFESGELSREACAGPDPVRRAFRRIFSLAGLPYFNPHSFRNTLVLMGLRLSRNPEEAKAWSQNLGHEGMLTTLVSYGTIPSYRQEQIFQNFSNLPADTDIFRQEILSMVQRFGHLLPGSCGGGGSLR